MSFWKSLIVDEWRRRKQADSRAFAPMLLPLTCDNLNELDVLAAVDSILSGQLTMNGAVADFEKAFAQYVDAPYAVMVNSGSSANLLAWAALTNPVHKRRIPAGSEVLIPAVCWSTSVWPIVQMGLTPVFVDVDPTTLNISVLDAQKKLTAKTKAVMAVHVLGNSTCMTDLMDLCVENNLLLVEDTCESLGSRARACGESRRHLGTFGDFGTYSFYYSHHLVCGEGGMIVCRTKEERDLLHSLRAHGWTRGTESGRKTEEAHPDVDSRFCFANLGYNVRPTEVSAAIGEEQLRRLNRMNLERNRNRNALVDEFLRHKDFRNQFAFPVAAHGTAPCWFGFPLLLRDDLVPRRDAFVRHLTKHGIDSRPIVSGNFLRQPAVKMLGIAGKPEDFPGAETVHSGLFVGAHSDPMSEATVSKVVDTMIGFWN